MANVVLKNINKKYPGGFHAVHDVNFEVKDKEFLVLVGPSGCGKSTTLRMVAGLEEITCGDLIIDGKKVNNLTSRDRDIAMVFQNYALYPHMTVYQNLAFGLKIRKFSKSVIDQRVKEAARILHIEDQLNKKPKELSGGQKQRVAMGRAFVRKPKVFLFDEPLSNLDAKLRVTMRTEIAKFHANLQTTIIYVTHDQTEAMTLGNRIVVMKDGYIQQIDTPLNIYNNPVNKFVAGFIGSPPMNFFDVKVKQIGQVIVVEHGDFVLTPTKEQQKKLEKYIGKEIIFGIRPEDLIANPKSENTINVTVDIIEPLGAEIFLYVSTIDNAELTACVDPHLEFKINDKIKLGVAIKKGHFFEGPKGSTNEADIPCIV